MAKRPKKATTDATDLSASTHAHNDLVTVEALELIAFDGDPDTAGSEYYAPDDFDLDAHKVANGIEGELLDGDGQAITIAGSRFETTLIQAEALGKARLVRVLA